MSLPDGMSTSGAPPSGKFTRRTSFVMPFPSLPTAHQRRSDLAIVTWVAGDAAYKWFSVTGPLMKRYADKVKADLIVLDGYASQPYSMANKFRVRQVFDEYGYECVMYVDADILISPECIDFFKLVPDGHVAILDEGLHYDYWMLAHYRHEAVELLESQGLDPDPSNIPTPKNAGFYLMPKAHKDALEHFQHPFPLCYRNGATVEQTWFCQMLHRHGVPLFTLKFPEQHWLWYLDQQEQATAKAMILHFCGLHEGGNRRYERLLANASRLEEGRCGGCYGRASSDTRPSMTKFESQMLLDHASPAALKMRDIFVISSHQYGWGVAQKALSVLSNPDGVLFDSFIESTFLWNLEENRRNRKVPYRESWVGFVHHPPHIPAWPSIAKHRVQDLANVPEWLESRQHCLGLFALTNYLAEWVRGAWGIKCESLKYPTLVPDKAFSLARFESQPTKTVAMIGFWLRRYSSFQMLRAPGYRKVRPLLVEDPNSKGIEHIRRYEKEEAAARGCENSEAEKVDIIPRLSNEDYDSLLSDAVVFLDLIDASAVTTVVECLARCTPLLINPLPAVTEYLGDDYPLYFQSLEEADKKLRDMGAIRAAHEHMIENPVKNALAPQHFLNTFVDTDTYRAVLWRCSLA